MIQLLNDNTQGIYNFNESEVEEICARYGESMPRLSDSTKSLLIGKCPKNVGLVHAKYWLVFWAIDYKFSFFSSLISRYHYSKWFKRTKCSGFYTPMDE